MNAIRFTFVLNRIWPEAVPPKATGFGAAAQGIHNLLICDDDGRREDTSFLSATHDLGFFAVQVSKVATLCDGRLILVANIIDQ